MIDADGQCSFESSGTSPINSKIECHAILKDGRTLTASFISDYNWTAVFGELRAPGQKPAPHPEACERILQTHGFLSRAQFQCHYRYYSMSMLQEAKACSANLSEERVKEIVGTGMKSFDRNESERGHDKLCRDILKDFGNFIRR